MCREPSERKQENKKKKKQNDSKINHRNESQTICHNSIQFARKCVLGGPLWRLARQTNWNCWNIQHSLAMGYNSHSIIPDAHNAISIWINSMIDFLVLKQTFTWHPLGRCRRTWICQTLAALIDLHTAPKSTRRFRIIISEFRRWVSVTTNLRRTECRWTSVVPCCDTIEILDNGISNVALAIWFSCIANVFFCFCFFLFNIFRSKFDCQWSKTGSPRMAAIYLWYAIASLDANCTDHQTQSSQVNQLNSGKCVFTFDRIFIVVEKSTCVLCRLSLIIIGTHLFILNFKTISHTLAGKIFLWIFSGPDNPPADCKQTTISSRRYQYSLLSSLQHLIADRNADDECTSDWLTDWRLTSDDNDTHRAKQMTSKF